MQKHDIYDRVTDFVVRVIKYSEKISKLFSGRIIAKQMVRSASSIGANMQEADGATTKKDFINKMGISRKEAQETRYWLDLLKKADIIKNHGNILELDNLHKESDEISKILSSIINKTIKNQ
ncbi:MAG: four helix bundle protein [Candidatus Saganbacteria bacterium]|nr:four helix bundle protein [Candidatus Saganbacteria bacterium]